MSGRKSLAKGWVVEEEHVARTNELTSFGSASNAGPSGSRRESQGLRVACKRHGTLGSGSDAPLQRSTPVGPQPHERVRMKHSARPGEG